MASDKLVDLGLARSMQVLKFVNRLKLDHIQPVGENAVWLPFQEVLALVCGDMGHGREYVGAVCRRAFDAVTMVNAALPSFVIDVKILEVVVKVDRACAEISAEKRGVCRENRCNIDVALATKGDCETGLPLVEVCDDCGGELARNILEFAVRTNRAHVWET